MDFAGAKADLVFAYRQYARLMDHWHAVLPPDRLIDIDYEELIAGREAVTRRLIAFAGLDWDDPALAPSATNAPCGLRACGRRGSRSMPPRLRAGGIMNHGWPTRFRGPGEGMSRGAEPPGPCADGSVR